MGGFSMLSRKEIKVIVLTALVTLAIFGVFDNFIRTHPTDHPDHAPGSLKFSALTSRKLLCRYHFRSICIHANDQFYS
jgi:hypothetical protein